MTGTAVRLPGKALLGLFLTGFAGILTECLPAGLLPDMARSLDTSVALTGQTVTLYAAAASIAAIPLSHAIRFVAGLGTAMIWPQLGGYRHGVMPWSME